jgi:hypothetical protein
LGQTQFGQQSDIISGIGSYGGLQREIEQGKLDVGYGDYAAQQEYPYQQLGFVSDIYNQMPTGQTVQTQTGASSSGVASLLGGLGSLFSLGKGLSIFNEGGEVKGYAMGGTAQANPMELDAAMKYMPEAGLQKMAQLTDVTELAKAQIAQKLQTNQDIRAAAQVQPQQAQQPTVAEEAVAEMYAGLGGAEMPQDFLNPEMMAGGGIVALSGGGDYEREARRSGAASIPTMGATPQQSPLAPSGIAQQAAPGAVKPKLDMYGARRAAVEEDTKALEGLNAKYEELLNDPAYNAALADTEAAIKAIPEYGAGLQALYEQEGEEAAKSMTSDMWFKAAEAFANFATAKEGEEGEKLAESLGVAAKGLGAIKKDYAQLERARKKDIELLKEERAAKAVDNKKAVLDIQAQRRKNELEIQKSRIDLAGEVAKLNQDAAGDILSSQTQTQVAGMYAANKGTGSKQSSAELRALQTSLTQELNKLVGESKNIFDPTQKVEHQAKIDDVSARLRDVQARLAELGGMTAEPTSTAGGLTTQGGRPVPAGGQKVYDFGSI